MSIEQYLPLFVVTFCLELAVYGILLNQVFSKKQILAISVLLNIITHPLVCFGFPGWFGNYYWILAELFAWVVEALILFALARWVVHHPIRSTKALATSLAANALSAGMGLVLF